MDTELQLLDQLLNSSRLYRSGKDFQELLDFVVRLRNFAPFNAMLLQIQKRGLSYAAFQVEWKKKFGRTLKPGARPLLILWPFGPVALVYDVMDTEGAPLPEDVATYHARGEIDPISFHNFQAILHRKGIRWDWIDAGDLNAGSVQRLSGPYEDKTPSSYQLLVNRNHPPAVQFNTLTHELAHLCLGHLGRDKKMGIPERRHLEKHQKELEAECAAYLVCRRNGVEPKSQRYLAGYIGSEADTRALDVYQVMRAAGQVETWLELTVPMSLSEASDSSEVPEE